MDRTPPSRRLIDLATLAPILGILLLVPPMIGLFASDKTIMGAPIILVYLFSVWFGLIVLAAILAHRLAQSDKSGEE